MKHTWMKKCLYAGLPMLGILFGLWYIKGATFDIVYTDYIRLVNDYLPDVWNPAKFFVPDVLTRIPVNYLARIVNVTFFDYRTTFDMALGVLGLGFAGLALGRYCEHYEVRWYWFVPLMVLMFGLNKWEMLTNGTGWAHFLAVGFFYYHYLVLDRVWYGTEKKHDRLKLMALPFLITLTMAGPYCAIYSVVMVLSYGFCMIVQARRAKTGGDKRYLVYMACVLAPFLLYLWSNSYAVEDHAGMQNLPLIQTVLETPGYFLHFFLKSFASDLVGGEMLKSWITAPGQVLTDAHIYLMGAGVIAAYLLAVWMNFRYRLYKTTVFPLMLLVTGGLNHLLILYSRWGFMDENYGMSSRYALQFQFVTLGIVLTLALLWKQVYRRVTGILALACCVAILAGSCMTTASELRMMPHRENYGAERGAVALKFQQLDDDVLREMFDYRKSREDSGAKVRNALEILYENRWNIFRQVP